MPEIETQVDVEEASTSYADELKEAEFKELEKEIMLKFPRIDPLLANTLAWYAIYEPEEFDKHSEKYFKGELTGGKPVEGGSIGLIPAELNKDDITHHAISLPIFEESSEGEPSGPSGVCDSIGCDQV
jgi:hypothetical protein